MSRYEQKKIHLHDGVGRNVIDDHTQNDGPNLNAAEKPDGLNRRRPVGSPSVRFHHQGDPKVTLNGTDGFVEIEMFSSRKILIPDVPPKRRAARNDSWFARLKLRFYTPSQIALANRKTTAKNSPARAPDRARSR
jgi:hypothetical protein